MFQTVGLYLFITTLTHLFLNLMIFYESKASGNVPNGITHPEIYHTELKSVSYTHLTLPTKRIV